MSKIKNYFKAQELAFLLVQTAEIQSSMDEEINATTESKTGITLTAENGREVFLLVTIHAKNATE